MSPICCSVDPLHFQNLNKDPSVLTSLHEQIYPYKLARTSENTKRLSILCALPTYFWREITRARGRPAVDPIMIPPWGCASSDWRIGAVAGHARCLLLDGTPTHYGSANGRRLVWNLDKASCLANTAMPHRSPSARVPRN